MTNRYSYNKDEKDLNGKMFSYDSHMQKYDFNSVALRRFASSLRWGKLEEIKQLFGDLSRQQKLGLITISINYNNFSCNYRSFDSPVGKSLDIATKFKYPTIVEYLTQILNSIDSTDTIELTEQCFDVSCFSFQ